MRHISTVQRSDDKRRTSASDVLMFARHDIDNDTLLYLPILKVINLIHIYTKRLGNVAEAGVF